MSNVQFPVLDLTSLYHRGSGKAEHALADKLTKIDAAGDKNFMINTAGEFAEAMKSLGPKEKQLFLRYARRPEGADSPAQLSRSACVKLVANSQKEGWEFTYYDSAQGDQPLSGAQVFARLDRGEIVNASIYRNESYVSEGYYVSQPMMHDKWVKPEQRTRTIRVDSAHFVCHEDLSAWAQLR